MIFYGTWVLISFFAVVGILCCLIGVIEFIALRRIHSISRVAMRVELKGEEQRMDYLLNSLSLVCDRFNIGGKEIILEIEDGGLSLESREALLKYCEKNPWVVFTES